MYFLYATSILNANQSTSSDNKVFPLASEEQDSFLGENDLE